MANLLGSRNRGCRNRCCNNNDSLLFFFLILVLIFNGDFFEGRAF